MAGSPAPVLRQRFFDSNGLPLAGGKLYSYQAGTTTPQATYTDSSLGTPNTNPVVMDASGYADVWLDQSLSYKFDLQDSSGVSQWTKDNFIGILTVDAVTAISIQAGAVTAPKLAYDAVHGQTIKLSPVAADEILLGDTAGAALKRATLQSVFDLKVVTLAANHTLTVDEDLALCSSAAFTVTLPAASATKKPVRIKKTDASATNIITVARAGADTIDGATSLTLVSKGDTVILISDGSSAWYVIDRIQDGASRAYVNFNGTGVVAVTRSFNVSSITDNGVGNYTVNFTTAFTDANYTFVGSGNGLAGTTPAIICENFDSPSRTTALLKIYTMNNGAGLIDVTEVNCAFFGVQ